ncbi:hypothetical protein RJ639_004685 [Escallonia herrerae]|uniref:FLZ-type domain-containing protein n=1 Tax=Escallonia herrerae TaxID=1293975 RepID=A0AA89B085_9ASTE|nr:hypothetical protein RJ639_004685 [Escallonia herrerae]
MAELKGSNKKRLTINLSFFAPNDHNNNKPTSKKFEEEPNGVVGLGIVAALNELDQNPSGRAAVLAVSPRSFPIPILSAKSGGKVGPTSEEMELSEEYTCVISHIGNNLIKKREYFDGELANGSDASYWVSSGVFTASSPPCHGGDAAAAAAGVFGDDGFLSCCYLCKKKLHGLDIFMYRGEKAFCSAECRCKQISIDERKEKKRSSAVKKPLEYSVSPCSGSMQFCAGVAAA